MNEIARPFVSRDKGVPDDQRDVLRESAEAFAERFQSKSRRRGLRHRSLSSDRAVWRQMAERGWLGSTFPAQYGGRALSFSEWAVIPETLGGAVSPEPITQAAILVGGVLRHAGGNVANQLLPMLAAGELLPALAWQEPGGSYDPEAVEARVTPGPKGQKLLSGTKSYVPYADVANGFVVSARKEEGLALYWIPADSQGLELSFHPLADGSMVGRIAFDRVPVKPAQRVCLGEKAVRALVASLDEATVMVSASLVGLMSTVLSVTTEHMKKGWSKSRDHGLQALQHRAVDLHIKRELSRGAVGDALAALDNETDPLARSAAASRAKARCSDAALETCREAVQLHGSFDCGDECDLGLYLRRALVLAAWLGNSSYHRRRFARLQGQMSGEHA